MGAVLAALRPLESDPAVKPASMGNPGDGEVRTDAGLMTDDGGVGAAEQCLALYTPRM